MDDLEMLTVAVWVLRELIAKFGPDVVNDAVSQLVHQEELTGVMTWAGRGRPGRPAEEE